MSNWRDEYFAALGVRDEREKANLPIYDACTFLSFLTGSIYTHTHIPSNNGQNKKIPVLRTALAVSIQKAMVVVVVVVVAVVIMLAGTPLNPRPQPTHQLHLQ